MKALLPALAAILLLAACETPESRIKKNQAAFVAYPPEIQQAIRQGRVQVGFSLEQVLMALGKPDQVVTEQTAAGARQEFLYGVSGPERVGFGFGVGGRMSSVGVGVAGSSGAGPWRLRVVLENGLVVSVQSRQR